MHKTTCRCKLIRQLYYSHSLHQNRWRMEDLFHEENLPILEPSYKPIKEKEKKLLCFEPFFARMFSFMIKLLFLIYFKYSEEALQNQSRSMTFKPKRCSINC